MGETGMGMMKLFLITRSQALLGKSRLRLDTLLFLSPTGGGPGIALKDDMIILCKKPREARHGKMFGGTDGRARIGFL
jgi:hypothetical protein